MDPITFGAGLLSSGIGFAGNWLLQEQQNKANKELWQKQTEYNTPANQITRLREAGLNPSLAYGKGVATNIAGAPPAMQRAEAPNVSSDISAVQQVDNATQQHKLLAEQARIAKANADVAEHDRDIWDNSPIPSNAGLWQGVTAGASNILDKAGAWFQRHMEKSAPGPLKAGIQFLEKTAR